MITLGEQTEDILAGDEARQFGQGPVWCKHELITDQCGLCKPRPPASPPAGTFPNDLFETAASPEDGPGPWIQASYSGECAGCGTWIHEGDLIRADGFGGWEGRLCCG